VYSISPGRVFNSFHAEQILITCSSGAILLSIELAPFSGRWRLCIHQFWHCSILSLAVAFSGHPHPAPRLTFDDISIKTQKA